MFSIFFFHFFRRKKFSFLFSCSFLLLHFFQIFFFAPPELDPPLRRTAQNFALFFPPLPPPFRSFCVSLGVFSWNFGGVFEGQNPQNVDGPGASNTTKIPPPFGAPTLRGPPFGAPPFGVHPSGPPAPFGATPLGVHPSGPKRVLVLPCFSLFCLRKILTVNLAKVGLAKVGHPNFGQSRSIKVGQSRSNKDGQSRFGQSRSQPMRRGAMRSTCEMGTLKNRFVIESTSGPMGFFHSDFNLVFCFFFFLTNETESKVSTSKGGLPTGKPVKPTTQLQQGRGQGPGCAAGARMELHLRNQA